MKPRGRDKAVANRNKERGNELERELRDQAHEHGLYAKRAWGSDGRSLGLSEDVDVVLEDFRVQCKRKKVLPAWIDADNYSDDVDFIVTRKDNTKRSLTVIPTEMFLQILKDRNRG